MANRADVKDGIINSDEKTRKGFNQKMYDSGEDYRLYPGPDDDQDGEDLAEDFLLLSPGDKQWVIDETANSLASVGGKKPC